MHRAETPPGAPRRGPDGPLDAAARAYRPGMTPTPDVGGLTALLALAEQDVADAGAALTSARLVDWTSTSATLFQEALAAAALQLSILDPVLASARTSLAQVST